MIDCILSGQTYLFDFENKSNVIMVGLCNDPACEKCNYEFDLIKEIDLMICPECGCYMDWSRWHKFN